MVRVSADLVAVPSLKSVSTEGMEAIAVRDPGSRRISLRWWGGGQGTFSPPSARHVRGKRKFRAVQIFPTAPRCRKRRPPAGWRRLRAESPALAAVEAKTDASRILFFRLARDPQRGFAHGPLMARV